ncbi:hypothetical protein JTB14_032607 [Gonioctena quinquepunctata]|nr:hypothetical protein JTB14_032607 [Gonioctena quinquepunctata]
MKSDIKLAYSSKSDPEESWNFINIKKYTSRIPGKMYYKNQPLSTPSTVIDAFAINFRSVYTADGEPNEGITITRG